MKKYIFTALALLPFVSSAHLHTDNNSKEVVAYTDTHVVSIELTNLYPFAIDFAVIVDGEHKGHTGQFQPDESDKIYIKLKTDHIGEVKIHQVCTQSVSATVCSEITVRRI